MYSIGYDIGSSSVKCALLEIESGSIIGKGFYPQEEMAISSPQPGWAEQDPSTWWDCLKTVTASVLSKTRIHVSDIKSIGIAYQMHGLVLVDKNHNPLRSAIIWCDSRAVETGNKALNDLGSSYCFEYLLNSPGNFTASKLRWVEENEPDIYSKIYKFMLPGDYIAMKLTGDISTTIPGLSEGMFWNFKDHSISGALLEYYNISETLVPDVKPVFSIQGTLSQAVANELGLQEGTVVSYRAGDQVNNALSLNVLNPGEIAATAGTSGVVYGVTDKIQPDPFSRINIFAHINHTQETKRLGALLCINGAGILNSWLKKNMASNLSYNEINRLATFAPIGSDKLTVLPFGNGAERILNNNNISGSLSGIDFNRHTQSHIFRAAQEGIAFAFQYGMEIMQEMGLPVNVIRAAEGNLFLSLVFRETLSTVSNAVIELYDTDGAQGAARGAAIGAGYYKSFQEAFGSLKKINVIYPDKSKSEQMISAYNHWKSKLTRKLQSAK